MNNPLIRQNLKKVTLVKSMSACFILTLGIYFTVFSVQSSIDVCSRSDLTIQTDENALPSSIQCSHKGNEVSWLAWITNKSTSKKFPNRRKTKKIKRKRERKIQDSTNKQVKKGRRERKKREKKGIERKKLEKK